jgi:hypothetical protein
MAVEEIGVFSIKPDWADGSIETLAWLTSTTESPQAVEQRMGLRISPRILFEYTYTVFNSRRSHFDLLNMAGAGSPLYVPMWFDRGLLTAAAAIGATVLNLDTRWTEFQNCRYAILYNDEYNFEVVEIDSFTDSTLTLAVGLTNGWPIRTEIYPVRKCRVESQVTGDRYADEAFKGRMRFQTLETCDSIAAPVVGTYLGNYVLETEPNDEGAIRYDYQRKEYILDTNVGTQLVSDVAPFINQNHHWFAKGRQRLWQLRGLLYAIQGKRRPIWVPSYFNDFELSEAADALDTVLTVLRCGYTDTGGPFTHRDHILIHLRDGTRIYRKIVDSAIVGAEGLYETIELDAAIGVDISPDTVLRISFITFCRLDQDSIELIHHSDSKGLTTANLVWRTDPGIGGTYSETTTEEPPFNPLSPSVKVIVDPFRNPVGKVWLYAPVFSSSILDTNWIAQRWSSRRSDAELLAQDNPNLPPDVGDVFPLASLTPDPSPHTVTLPDTGSFLVRAGIYFNGSNDPPISIAVQIYFINSELEPVGDIAGAGIPWVFFTAGRRLQLQSGRDQVFYAKTDPNQPLQVQMRYQVLGFDDPDTLPIGGNVHPVANPTNDAEPYHGKAGAVAGDAYFIVEWWPD